MDQEINFKEISSQEIYEKWSPVIEAKYGIIDKRKVKSLCNYAHYHSLSESEMSATTFGTINKDTISLLPMALNVLAGLQNLHMVHLTSGADGIPPQRSIVNFELTNEMVMDLKNSTLDSVSIIEDFLVKKAIKYIDDAIKKEKEIAGEDSITIMNTSQIIESIMIISEATLAPKMSLKISFGLKSYK